MFIPTDHSRMLKKVLKMLAYSIPSAPNSAWISGKPMYPAFEKVMAKRVSALSPPPRRVTAAAMTSPSSSTPRLARAVRARLPKMAGSKGIM